jgi:hypothetical protein
MKQFGPATRELLLGRDSHRFGGAGRGGLLGATFTISRRPCHSASCSRRASPSGTVVKVYVCERDGSGDQRERAGEVAIDELIPVNDPTGSAGEAV